MQCSFFYFRYYLSVFVFLQLFHESLKLFWAWNTWRHLDRCRHTCRNESYGCCMWARVALSQLLYVHLCSLLVLAHTHTHTHIVIVLTCLWNSTGALLSSPLLSSLPPRLLLCSSHSFLPPPLREEKICHSLPLTAEWWTTKWRGLSSNCERGDYPVVTLTPASLEAEGGQKMGTKEECCPKHEVGKQLMMLPEDVLEVWRDVNNSHSYSLFPPSLSFSFFFHLAAFRAYSERFWDPGHLPFFLIFLFFPLCPGEFVCSN